jgi:hypothetical protein
MIGARERPTESPRWSYAPQPQPNPNLTTMRGHSVSPAHLGTPPSAPGGACLATVAPQKNAAQDAPQAASFPRAPSGPHTPYHIQRRNELRPRRVTCATPLVLEPNNKASGTLGRRPAVDNFRRAFFFAARALGRKPPAPLPRCFQGCSNDTRILRL